MTCAASTLKLAFAGARLRRLQSALTLLVVAAAAAALTIGLAVGRVADRPFERTFEATNGAHVTAATVEAEHRPRPRSSELPGVVESTGERPIVLTAFDRDGKLFGLRLVGLGNAAPTCSPLLLVEGRRRAPARSCSSAASPASTTSAGRLDASGTPWAAPLRVSGIAVVVAVGNAYPQSQPGIGFARAATLAPS